MHGRTSRRTSGGGPDAERVAIAEAVSEEYKAQAKERQRHHGGTAPGKPKDTSDPRNGSVDHRESRAVIAEVAGFGSAATYERAKKLARK